MATPEPLDVKSPPSDTCQGDEALLCEMASWRGMLAENIAHRNPCLDEGQVDAAVHGVMNRLVNLGISKTLGIEQDGQTASDCLPSGVRVDERIIDAILAGLLSPQHRPALTARPADLLGRVYERFLGEAVRLRTERRVTIEAYPEGRRAGGVFYTPPHIVDFIVRRTVGALVKGKRNITTLPYIMLWKALARRLVSMVYLLHGARNKMETF